MNFKQQVIIFLIIITGLLGIIFTYLPQHKKSTQPVIVCTTTIIADAVHNIVHDKARVHTLMGPGVDPHTYKPVESDVAHLAQADIIFYNGLHLEARLADILHKLARTQTTVAVSKDIKDTQLIQSAEFEKHYDPHIWFDITLWKQAVHTIYQTVCTQFPEHKKQLAQHYEQYKQQLTTTQKKIHHLVERLPLSTRILITAHDAFSYFARAYNFTVISLQGINTQSIANPRDVHNIITYICTHKVPAVFPESSLPNRNVLVLQQGALQQGWSIALGEELFSDALGGPHSAGATYIDMLMYNTSTIVHSLLRQN